MSYDFQTDAIMLILASSGEGAATHWSEIRSREDVSHPLDLFHYQPRVDLVINKFILFQ